MDIDTEKLKSTGWGTEDIPKDPGTNYRRKYMADETKKDYEDYLQR